AEVGEDDVEILLRDLLERPLRVRRRGDLEAVTAERHLEQVARLLLIVDDQDVTFHAFNPSTIVPQLFCWQCRSAAAGAVPTGEAAENRSRSRPLGLPG